MAHDPALWPAVVIGAVWLLTIGTCVLRLWSGLRLGRIRWRTTTYERTANPTSYWTVAGVYGVLPAITLALLAWLLTRV